MNDNGAPCLSDMDQVHEVVRLVIRRGNIRMISKALGLADSTVYGWAQYPEESRHGMPARYIVPFTLAARDALLIRWLANQCGGVFVEWPEAPASLASISAELSAALKETSDVMRVWSDAIYDNRLDLKEIADIRRELADALRCLVRLDRILLVEGGKPC